ncbi:MAG: nucleotide disphospho-sugar-binding domain-containing protein [Jannaschia sp.]
MLSTIGSLGDLYPVLALALALEARGIRARLALSPDDCAVARDWGLDATAVGPSEAEVCAALGLTRDGIAASVLRDPGPLLSRALIPLLPAMTTQVRDLARDAGCIAGTTFALHASLAAERNALPYAPILLQPMVTFSAHDPPAVPAFRAAVRAPRNRLSLIWNRGIVAAARAVLRRRHGAELSAVRAGFDLSPQPGTPLLDHGAEVPLRLGLWSPSFASIPPDAPPNLRVTGFPPAPRGELPDDIRRWIAAGPAPLIVTLGSIAQGLGGARFWTEAVAMAREMGLRAILLHGSATVPEGSELLARPYAPHAPLFPLAAAIVHHGGIGTTTEALRSGRPQLVVPVGGDQPDNAARLVRMGVAVTVPIERFTATRGGVALSALLDRFDDAGAMDLAARITGEDGADNAAALLEGIVAR